jgi:hypothetical protein
MKFLVYELPRYDLAQLKNIGRAHHQVLQKYFGGFSLVEESNVREDIVKMYGPRNDTDCFLDYYLVRGSEVCWPDRANNHICEIRQHCYFEVQDSGYIYFINGVGWRMWYLCCDQRPACIYAFENDNDAVLFKLAVS